MERKLGHHPMAYRGWTMAAVGFVSVALVFGATVATLPLVFAAVVEELGWSRTDAALLFTYKSAASAAVALFLVGPLLLRFGLRKVILASFVLAAAGMLAFLAVDSLATFYAVGCVLGMGASTTMIAVNVFVSRWFSRHQGLALGATFAGVSAGGAVFPLLAAALIDSVGWRAALAVLSLSIWLVALPVYLWKAEEEPTADDLAAEPGRRHARDPAPDGDRAAFPGARLGPLLATRTFWRIAAALFLVAAADGAVLQHTPLLLGGDAGLGGDLATASLSIMFALGVVGKLAAGRLYDAASVKGMAFWDILVAASIACAAVVEGAVTLLLFTLARGLAHGGLVPKLGVLAKHCYGPHLLSVVLPVFTGIWVLGAGTGPLVLAMFFDADGDYTRGLLLLVAVSVLAALLIKDVRPAYRDAIPMPAAPRAARLGESR
ncbi:MAG TPA: MFS transporter [Gammaproteobacteria bacterium]